MASFEQTLEILEDLTDNILKTKANFKKAPKIRLTKGFVEARLQSLEDYWNSYKNGYQNLLKNTKKEQRKNIAFFKEELYSQCEEVYLDLKSDMIDMLQSLNEKKKEDSSQNASSQLEELSDSEVKLPRLNLPTFSGAYEDWQSFEDTFTVVVHNNKKLKNVQKLFYLKSCLTGEARNAIKHIKTTERNYENAWDTLKTRYSHKRLIMNSILKRLFSLKKVNTYLPMQIKTLIDSTKECLHSLNNLDISTTGWDPMIIFLTVQKLDRETHSEWETFVSREYKIELPTFTNFITFLVDRIHTLELTTQVPLNCQKINKETRSLHTTTIQVACKLCNGEHLLCHCKEFVKFDPEKRIEIVKTNQLCYNCLSSGHPVYNCRQKNSCKICGKRHHSLLHYKKKQYSQEIEKINNTPGISTMHAKENIQEALQDESIVSNFACKQNRGLLATALVVAKNEFGQETTLRALIDPGSQASFITESATQLLRLKKTHVQGSITGVGATTTSVNYVVQLKIISRYDKHFNTPVRAYVLKSCITSKLPSSSIRPNRMWSHLDGLYLADPQYFVSSKIDLLLGIDVYTEIVKNNLVKGPPGSPSAQETSLGWILFGNILESIRSNNHVVVMHHHIDVNMDTLLKNLWSIDESTKRKLTSEEKICEEIYHTTHTRTAEGRYVVTLPFKTSPENIGSTRSIALKRLEQLERKLENKPKLKEEYSKVMEEYIQLNHMEKVPKEELDKPAIYLPHHAVVREDSETTKVRVVFDASCKSSNNTSLNDMLLVGPQLQEDLRNLIMRCRLKKICFIADIQKMYRMILIAKDNLDYQRILWRRDPTQEVEDYRMLRVTFGTASAPYLAIKTLQQLSIDEESKYPIGARILSEDFYVDDCISGHSTLEEAIEASKQLIELLKTGGFILQKWASNCKEFIEQIPESLRSASINKGLIKESIIKTLGLSWNMTTDSFSYQIKLPPKSTIATKRIILADLQRLFDPLGWISPAIVPAKILLQTIWMKGLDWDENVGKIHTEEWEKIRDSFNSLHRIRIKRWIHTGKEIDKIQLHGYCDASMKAYCAVVYYRVEIENGDIKTGIIASKTRVAPVKAISLPRLELCGALLLANLLTQVREAMRLQQNQIYAWTDSTVVLSWLLGDPKRWKPFVSNRVIEILDNTSNTQWFHVKSIDNPADLGSRGTYLENLIDNKFWWEGPEWLKKKHINLSKPNVKPTEIEIKKIVVNSKIVTEECKVINFEKFYELQELLRTIVYSLRFLRYKKNPENIDKGITTSELESSLLKCIKIAQKEEFIKEIENLLKKRNISKESKLKTLNPYLDENNVLRVGGRLRNSNLSYDQKHPIILDTNGHLTYLIVAEAHRKTLHGGIQLMLSYIQSKYWIIRVKTVIKKCIHQCIICAKHRALSRTQLMGDLPSVRTVPARPFKHSGVDFAGPLQILMSKGRGAKTKKAYIAIFICMAVKAIHLELVSDLTSEAFIGAFHRFVSRRGRCTEIWSDHGRNFVGANKELQTAWKEANLDLPGHLVDILAADGTQWKFIPPYSPNFGGLWEAGVKSTKYHLRRILDSHLTYEELTTILCQIEACLNSRPLIPIDTTNAELDILTPGHFLIGEAPVTIPNPDLREQKISYLSRWQLSQRLVANFWHRWQTEYLSRLQTRPKWMKIQREFEIGDIVILKDDQLPPGKWSLGRIIAKHPGEDGLTRVYSIKCRNGIVKRSLSKICALPIDNNA
ncbi:uncharacterized protein LOC119190306 [Manduca sexta]|uniref:uncharacterized protein LOC119190306 n=1 Tax=Manduca sexta TaxID=7130 RepID=UPI00188FEF23|nr:uncharacterized protein LOC119190306 [Manduca sexta]